MQTLPGDFCPVPEQISRIGDNYPHSIALSYGHQRLSYEELARQADQFAGYLVQLGLVSGGTVAICMERSFDWIVTALGTMRTGAAYVPLDCTWPDSRLRFAVEDSGASVLVARAALFGSTPNENVRRRSLPGFCGHRCHAGRGTHTHRACEPGLCNLHLRDNRSSQRGGDHACQSVSPHSLAPSCL